jgi:putative endonuclease
LNGARQNRQRAERSGRRAEIWAALWLRLKGYRILQTRYKTKLGEIDLIAKKGKAIVFIEVKHRRNAEDGLHSVTDFQARRIGDAAELYMVKAYRKHPDAEMRFDIMITGARFFPIHIRDAWR